MLCFLLRRGAERHEPGVVGGCVRITKGLGTWAILTEGSTESEKRTPGNRLGKGSDLSKHHLDDMADGVGRVFGSSRPLQSSVDEQLQEIESERPEKQDGHESVGSVSKHVREVPVTDPLVKGSVFDVPPGSDGLEGCGEG